ncbi:chemotaxis protein CheA [Pseudodesulfovibrio sp.]|uniref:chemotaxis protein CheA n=1 Tax=Pseudodesulfovibrio sp. TaxID=2035812 RepID=UPI0026204F27|nr:chemotaxis protein CheA [Pseudodesulfovibrio sp.]MDD3310821.1 chemotaxis protein CheA [Pseudodesulfovibrio sp.]
MSDDLNRQIFKEEAYDLLTELEAALLELEQSPEEIDLVNQVFRALHTIKGSGSMFGFEDIAEFTHEVESVFDMVRNGDLPVTPELCSLALKSRDYIKKMLDASDSSEVVAPEMMEDILTGLRNVAGGGAGADEPAAESAAGAEQEAAESGDAAEPVGGSPTGETEAPHVYRIVLSSKSARNIDPDVLDGLLAELGKLGELQVTPPVGDAQEGEPVSWTVRMVSSVDKDAVYDVFFFTDADIGVNVSEEGEEPEGPGDASDEVAPEAVAEPSAPVVEKPAAPVAPVRAAADDLHEEMDFGEETPRLGEILVKSGAVSEDDVRDALRKQRSLGQILKDEGKVEPEKIESAAKIQAQARERDAHRKKQEALSSIRVAADKLDYLVDLVGELVIVQAQITQVVSERADPALTALAEELERLSDELRDSTLGIRMLPIGTSFSKFKRLVRDLSAELGKEISLATSGEDTELDKTVIERLGDPLVHLLRNSIDHGIETPEERKAAGKSPQGLIMLAAEHSGGEVLIRITDDGRGMAPEMIREKAIERGMITRDSDMSEKELLKLIFEPGFSTAKTVTNVSGRGVGMDVVKRAIDSLRGSIDIDSKPGKGTTLTIRLPLTLAIIDGLQVKVEDGFYVIPLSLVEECVELSRKDVEEDSDQRILHLRGEIVPYIHLREWFGIEGENPPIEQIVITGVEGSRVGIVVDTVIGEHQTVIKSLGRVYKDVEGLSGATIKGDGSIALILDIPSLVRRVIAESR